MSIAPVSGIKVPVSFMANNKADENAKPKIDPSKEVDKFNKEANEVAEALEDTGAAVTKVTGAAASVAAPVIAIKATAGNFISNLFKTVVKDDNGNKIVDFSKTAQDLVEEVADGAGNTVKKLKDGLTEEQMKQVIYKTKNSKVKIGIAIAAAVVAGIAIVKSVMDKKKAEAAEAEAEKAQEAQEAPEASAEAEAVEETEETPEEE